MRINEHAALVSNQVILVPYGQHHVPTYHGWMKDPDIQAATASEPLSLKEEYAMQRSWREDADKLTFILCLPHALSSSHSDYTTEIASMIGDVNMFIAYYEDTDGPALLVGELEIMVATRDFQRKGFGRAGLLCFLAYVQQHETSIVQQFTQANTDPNKPTRFDHLTAKIGESNERSLCLFESLGFTRTTSTPNYFGEFELRLKSLSLSTLTNQMNKHNIKDFHEIEYRVSISADEGLN